MGESYVFQPYETVPLAATAASSSVAFRLPASGPACPRCQVYNAGPDDAFVGFGKGSATAALPGVTGTLQATPVPAGAIMTLTKEDADACAGLSLGTSQLYFTAGKGE